MRVPDLDDRSTTIGVVAIALGALLLRTVALGGRVFHWDEARVGYWILQYQESGVWSYRAIVHGPFLFHVNEVMFSVFGPSDFVARLVVAIVGATLPLGALVFHTRLDSIETLALAVFLAINPVLVYYSRFMRNDVLVAAFALVAVGFFVRLIDTCRARYLYATAGMLALAITTKEILLVYVVIWIGVLAVLLDNRLLAARFRSERPSELVRSHVSRVFDALRQWAVPIVVAAVEFLLVVVLFYAPRPDLYRALANPMHLPGVLEAATVDAWKELWGLWVAGGKEHSYIDYLLATLEPLGASSVPLVGFAIVGFLRDRYATRTPRDVVTAGFAWGVAVLLIYPAITDIPAPWSLVHVVVPLALPAAVGLAFVIRIGSTAVDDGDRVSALVVAAILLLAFGLAGVTAYETSFANPQDDENPLVQYGQPGGELHPVFADIDAVAAHNEGVDVLYYGEHFYVPNETRSRDTGAWTNRFPLTWYLERSDATIDSTTSPESVTGDAPVVIALAEDYSTIDDQLEGYEALTYEITATNTETVFFIDRSALNESAVGARMKPDRLPDRRSHEFENPGTPTTNDGTRGPSR